MFPVAPQTDLIRSEQKDYFYTRQLTTNCQELCATLLGRSSTHYKAEIELASRALYYGVTTLAGRSTLGEEYCDILQVTSERLTLPSFSRRLKLVGIALLLPYMYKKVRIQGRHVPVENDMNIIQKASRSAWNTLVSLIRHADDTLARLERLHLALFYLFGVYLQFSKRLAGIRYLYLGKIFVPRPSFELLGLLILFQYVIKMIIHIREQRAAASGGGANGALRLAGNGAFDNGVGIDGEEEEDDNDTPSCNLCLMPRRNTTVTECGHLFCWECICESINNRPECPMCRSAVSLQRLVLLCQY